MLLAGCDDDDPRRAVTATAGEAVATGSRRTVITRTDGGIVGL